MEKIDLIKSLAIEIIQSIESYLQEEKKDPFDIFALDNRFEKKIKFYLDLISDIKYNELSTCSKYYVDKSQEFQDELDERDRLQKEYDELNSPSALADYFGTDVESIAKELGKSPNEINSDDIYESRGF